MPVRTFTVYPLPTTKADSVHSDDIAYGIRATYPEPRLERRYGALEVCRGWTRDQVLAKFRNVRREDAAALLGRDLSASRAVQIQMGSDELRLWNN